MTTIVNLADDGVSSFSTTGSISESSNSLTVADASGFAINDYLIIEIGGEAGAGLRGTIGVGGAWPNLSYANAGVMNADTGQPGETYAYLVDTGNVYQSIGGVWFQQTNYYLAKVIPRSLAAKITGKSGNVLTLDDTATVSTTSANVYFDNAPIYNAHVGDPNDQEVIWPSGNFAVSQTCDAAGGKSNWHVHGTSKTATKLFFPDGISDHSVLVVSSFGSNNQVSNLCVQGNARAQGYMISDRVNEFAKGVWFSQNATGSITDTKSIDIFQGGATVDGCGGVSVYRHDAVLTEGLLTYIQWQVLGANSSDGAFVDCTVTSPTLTGGIEWFASTGVSIQNYVGVNASMSMNTSNNWTISSPTVTIEADSQFDETSFSSSNPIININTNIGGSTVALGGTISNPTITIQDYINADNDILRGIIVNEDNPNITIQGGSYTAPDYASPGRSPGSVGLLSTGTNTRVSCFTVYGQVEAGALEGGRSNISLNSGSILYCRALAIYAGPLVITNANGVPTDPQNSICTATIRLIYRKI